MKLKALLSTAALTFIFQCANAQFSLTPSAGVNVCRGFATENVSRVLKSKPIVYPFLGLQPAYNFGEKYKVGLDVQLSAKGFNNIHNIDYGTDSIGHSFEIGLTKARLLYVDLLPNFEYKPVKFMSFYAGANIGLKVNESYQIEDKWINAGRGSFYSKLDLGALAGVKFHYKEFSLSLHYNRSLKSILADEMVLMDINGSSIGKMRVFNQSLQVGLGYRLNFKKRAS